MADEQRINGNMYSWSSIVVRIDDERFYGIKSITYGDSRERAKGYGMGRSHAPRGRSAGKYETDPVVVSMEPQTARALRDALAQRAADGQSFGNVEFDVVVQYVEADDTPITDTIEQCVWTKNEKSNEEGPDPLMVDVEWDCMRIRWNGKTLFDETEG